MSGWLAGLLVAALLFCAAPSIAISGGTDVVLEVKSDNRASDTGISAPLPTQPSVRAPRREPPASFSLWLREILSLLFGERLRFFGPTHP